MAAKSATGMCVLFDCLFIYFVFIIDKMIIFDPCVDCRNGGCTRTGIVWDKDK